MLVTLIVVGLLIGLLWLGVLLAFQGDDHRRYDLPRPVAKGKRDCESTEQKAVVQRMLDDRATTPKMSRKRLLERLRTQMDDSGAEFVVSSKIRPIVVDGVNAEWVMAANADPNRRVLYIHGGAYMIGSPKSHRLITSRLSEIANAAVLAVDYRLMPENGRMAGIIDCQNAYRWVLENGPDGRSDADVLVVAGDSAGGNLALSTIAWARDAQLRPADAVVVFSPQTDLTLASPSLLSNIDTDIMLGISFGPMVKARKVVALSSSFLMNKINPSNALVSPLFGDLSGLPPTLVQASEAEMLLDDAVRYVNKATAQGSTAIIQTWPFTLHVWQAFQTPEADEAFAAVEEFLSSRTMNIPSKTND